MEAARIYPISDGMLSGVDFGGQAGMLPVHRTDTMSPRGIVSRLIPVLLWRRPARGGEQFTRRGVSPGVSNTLSPLKSHSVG
jgi:hypothetical protein